MPQENAWILYDDYTREELHFSDYGDITSPGLQSETFTDLAPGRYVFLMLDELLAHWFQGWDHYHPDFHGHYHAGCADDDSGAYISIGFRSFHPNYGYDIYEYKKIVSSGGNTHHYQIRSLD